MSARLPLVAAQPGIWMAEKLSTLPNAWSVAHYVDITSAALDAPLLCEAIATGMTQADTLRMRFVEDNGEVFQYVDEALTLAAPVRIDVRDAACPHRAALALMWQAAGAPRAVAHRRRSLVLVSALSPFAGRWLQLPGHYPPDRRHLSRLAQRRTHAAVTLYPFC